MKQILSQILDKIELYAGEERFAQELERAKEKFFNPVGFASENSEIAELELANFIEWFIFDWKLEEGKSLWEKFFKEQGENLTPLEKTLLEGFAHQFYSLFLVKKITNQQAVVKDIITRKKINPVYGLSAGIEKGDFILARIVFPAGQACFTEAFFYLPRTLAKFYQKKARLVRKNQLEKEKFLEELRSIAIKFQRYPRMKLEEYYQ